ncbi:hypothetical protein GOB86_01005 [Acetobacter lambici]|uniref:Lipoprotein n=1 Tax=Acetobacter lambici TaxID=1332824 RepID=A0ABT1EW35_9PROT|nr:hypothetical protein [Acetobacter lambici]MCP1241156.1 hypothetical protein [Acetobacter lambici]MCP1257172.1 hypothetical protein [Acetobacter lambici]NHO55664.1 hypothetical protein [Acetobacter lambici]
MKRPVFRFFCKASPFAVLLALVGVAGCQSVPYQLKVEQTPSTLLYSYAIANGMARGQLMSGGLTLPQIVHIVTADRAALAAILAFRDHPGSNTLKVAGLKVEDFLATIDEPAIFSGSMMVVPNGAPVPLSQH